MCRGVCENIRSLRLLQVFFSLPSVKPTLHKRHWRAHARTGLAGKHVLGRNETFMNVFVRLAFVWIDAGHHAANSGRGTAAKVTKGVLTSVSELVISRKTILLRLKYTETIVLRYCRPLRVLYIYCWRIVPWRWGVCLSVHGS